MRAEKFNFTKNLVFLGIIVSSCICSLLSEFNDSRGFNNPIMQTWIMFFSESLCLILAFYERKRKLTNPNELSFITNPTSNSSTFVKKISKFTPCISAICDLISSAFVYFSFLHLAGPEIATARIFDMFYILLYKSYIQKRKNYPHQKIGIVLLIIGTIGITLNIALFNKSKYSFDLIRFLYIMLMLLGSFFSVLHLITTEYSMKIQCFSPSETIGLQGITGFLLSGVLYVPANCIYYESYSDKILEKPFIAFKSGIQSTLIISSIAALFIFNYLTSKGIKLTDSLSICTLEPGKGLINWIVFIIMSYNNVTIFDWINLIFAILSTVGMLIFNETIILPCNNMKKAAMRSIKENEAFREAKFLGRVWQFKLEGLDK